MNFSPLKSGTSVEGDEIKAFRSDEKGEKYIYLIGGVHGDEVEGVHVVAQIFDWLKSDDKISLPMIIIPTLNVDGVRAGARTNSHGVDLNRNLDTNCWSSEAAEAKYYPGIGPLSEPENQFLVGLFNKFTPGLILSIHSWKPIVNYNGDCKDVAQYLADHNKYPIADDIGYPTPGSLGTYGPEKYNCPVLTFECPTITDFDTSLDQIWRENEEGFKGIFIDKIYQRFI